jgi:shikimate dehydrogenase
MTKLYAVAGNPVFHSRSPAIFNAAFRELGIDAVYMRLAASSAREVMETIRDMALSGMNVTAPFKTGILDYLDVVDADAREAGAVNTVVMRAGKYEGRNTDIAGVAGALESVGCAASGQTAVVLGAGGAGRAAAIALQKAGARVVMVNRTLEKAEAVAHTLGCSAMPLDQLNAALADAGLLVSTISGAEPVVDPALLSIGLTVLDADYARRSPLVEAAGRAGCTVVDGREWLLAQALPAFTLFTGSAGPTDKMRKVLWKPKGDARRSIALIGFMGAGKSAVGKALAALMGMAFIDIDARIEDKTGSTITEIFRTSGEEHFRRLEQEEIEEARLDARQVVACGGGAVLNRSNVRVLRNNFLSVWLWANAETALERDGAAGTRPLLDQPDPAAGAKTLLQRRIPHYASTCDLLINTEERTPQQIAERIWDEVRHIFSD